MCFERSPWPSVCDEEEAAPLEAVAIPDVGQLLRVMVWPVTRGQSDFSDAGWAGGARAPNFKFHSCPTSCLGRNTEGVQTRVVVDR